MDVSDCAKDIHLGSRALWVVIEMRSLRDWPAPVRAVFSALVAALGFVVLFIIVGLVPYCVMLARYGLKDVYDSPGHGGALLMLTIPLGVFLGIGAFQLLYRRLYRITSR